MSTKRDKEMAAAIDRMEAEDDEDETEIFHRPAPPVEAAQVYSVRIPAERLEQLRVIAATQGAKPSALMRQWVIERLDAELEHRGTSQFLLVFGSRKTQLAEQHTAFDLPRAIHDVFSRASRMEKVG